jgi:hypothetical protein
MTGGNPRDEHAAALAVSGTNGGVQRYIAWYHELDAWTEYWDIYHPETRGRYYFGDDASEAGLLSQLLPRERRPPVFIAWTEMALLTKPPSVFAERVRVPEIAAAVMEVDALIGRLFAKHFGDSAEPGVREDYLEGMFCFAANSLPPAVERDSKITDADPRKPTAGRHMLDCDLMWFAWALQIEAAQEVAGTDEGHARRNLLLAGAALGCAVNFASRGHRRTRSEYLPWPQNAGLLRERGRRFALDFEAAADEMHALYRIREWGEEA